MQPFEHLTSRARKSLAEIEAIAKTKGWSNMATAEKICQGTVPGKDARIMNKLKKDLPSFVKTIKALQQLAADVSCSAVRSFTLR